MSVHSSGKSGISNKPTALTQAQFGSRCYRVFKLSNEVPGVMAVGKDFAKHIGSSRIQMHFPFPRGAVGIWILAEKFLRPSISKTLLSMSLSTLLMKGRHELLIICAE